MVSETIFGRAPARKSRKMVSDTISVSDVGCVEENVGKRFEAMLRLGASKPWPEALAAFETCFG